MFLEQDSDKTYSKVSLFDLPTLVQETYIKF